MAENESLDSPKSFKWKKFLRDLQDSRPISELRLQFEKLVYKQYREIHKDTPKLAELLNSLDNPSKLCSLCEKENVDPVISDLLTLSAEKKGGIESKIQAFFQMVTDNFTYAIPYKAGELYSDINMTQVRGTVDILKAQFAPQYQRLSKIFTTKSNPKIRRPSRKSTKSKTQTLSDFMSTSLVR